MQVLDALLRADAELHEIPELDGRGRTALRAGGDHVRLEPVVAERALPCPAVVLAPVDDAEGARGDAVAAAVADVGLHVARVELGAHQRPGRTALQASRARTVLANVAHHQPGEVPRAGHLRAERHRPLDEGDVTPGRRAQVLAVVVGEPGEAEAVVRQLVPLLAGHLAGLAADAERRVGEEALLAHALLLRQLVLFRDPSLERLHLGQIARKLRHARAQLAAVRRPALPRAPAGLDVAGERLRFLDVHVGIADERGEVVGRVALDEAYETPVIGKADLVHHLAAHAQYRHPAGHHDARLDLAARRGDGRPSAVP